VFVLVYTEWDIYLMWLIILPSPKFALLSAFFTLNTWKIISEFCSVCGKSVMSEGPLAQWCSVLKDGRRNVHDKGWSGRSAICSEWWSCSNCFPNNLRKENFRILCEFLQISHTDLYEFITVRLGYHKLCTRWVPKMLKGAQKAQRMTSALTFLEWCYKDSDEYLNHIVRIKGDKT
jgi:hypothetical protein